MNDAGLGLKSSAGFLIRLQVIRSLAALSQRSPPQVGDVVPERVECATVCGDRMVFKEAGYDLPQAFSLFGDRLVPASSHFLLDFLELRSHAVAAGFTLQHEAPAA